MGTAQLIVFEEVHARRFCGKNGWLMCSLCAVTGYPHTSVGSERR
jgi:hypothetical protein